MADIKDLEPLIGRWSQVVDAPRHVEEEVRGDMTLEWLRGEKVIFQRSIAENRMFLEGVVLIMAADEDAEGDFTAHYFDSRVLHMSFHDGVWRWWRHATGPDDFRSALRRHAFSRRQDDRQLLLSRRGRRVDSRFRRHLHAGLGSVRRPYPKHWSERMQAWAEYPDLNRTSGRITCAAPVSARARSAPTSIRASCDSAPGHSERARRRAPHR